MHHGLHLRGTELCGIFISDKCNLSYYSSYFYTIKQGTLLCECMNTTKFQNVCDEQYCALNRIWVSRSTRCF